MQAGSAPPVKVGDGSDCPCFGCNASGRQRHPTPRHGGDGDGRRAAPTPPPVGVWRPFPGDTGRRHDGTRLPPPPAPTWLRCRRLLPMKGRQAADEAPRPRRWGARERASAYHCTAFGHPPPRPSGTARTARGSSRGPCAQHRTCSRPTRTCGASPLRGGEGQPLPHLPQGRGGAGAGAGRTVLDVGAYRGYFLDVAREAGFRPEGLELSRWAAGHARSLGFTVHGVPLASRGVPYGVVMLWVEWRPRRRWACSWPSRRRTWGGWCLGVARERDWAWRLRCRGAERGVPRWCVTHYHHPVRHRPGDDLGAAEVLPVNGDLEGAGPPGA